MTSNRNVPYQIGADSLHLYIRLTPNSSKDEVFAIEQNDSAPYFKARVKAQPEKGKANTALIQLIAKWLKTPKSKVTIKSGSQSRLKSIEISNPGSETIEHLMNAVDGFS